MNTTSTIDLGDNDSWIGPDPAPIEFIPARTSATHRHYPKERLLTPEQLAERLDYWQHRLCLDQWVIELRVVGEGVIEGKGRCETLMTKNRARVSLLRHDLHPEDAAPYDMEQILVHELLHIHFAAWDCWTLEDGKPVMSDVEEAVCVEQPIERLSWVLIELNRANEHLTAARDLYQSNANELSKMNTELLDRQDDLDAELDALNAKVDSQLDLQPMPPRACPTCPPRPGQPPKESAS